MNTPQQAQDILWTADLVCPVAAPPIVRGAIFVSGDLIAAVGPAAELAAAYPGARRMDCGRAIIIPGLVNAHTHLELTGLDSHYENPTDGMAEWIIRLVGEVRTWPPHLHLASARLGAAASLLAGVTCVGDISRSGESALAIADAGLRGVVFHEVVGIDPASAGEIVREGLAEKREMPEVRGGLADGVRHGASPHAPYSTSLALYQEVLALAGARGWTSATHLAESPGEVAFLRDGSGPFAGMYRALDVSAASFIPPGVSPVAYLDDGDVLGGLGIAVHCNQTDALDWERLRRAGVWVCLCPRTAAYFGHPAADAAGMRAADLKLCLGTDSRASSPSLSVLDEARALMTLDPDIPAAALLAMCTRQGAEALGFADDGVGALAPGGVADFAVAVPPGEKPPELSDLFREETEIRCTVTGGEVRIGGIVE